MSVLNLERWTKCGCPDMSIIQLESRLREFITCKCRLVRAHVLNQCRTFFLPALKLRCSLGCCQNPVSVCYSISKFCRRFLFSLDSPCCQILKEIHSCSTCTSFNEAPHPDYLCSNAACLECPLRDMQPARIFQTLNFLFSDLGDEKQKSVGILTDLIDTKCKLESIEIMYSEDKDFFPPLAGTLESTLECY